MKKSILKPALLLLMLVSLTGCELAGDIFEAGVSVGVFIVIAVLILIVWLIFKMKK